MNYSVHKITVHGNGNHQFICESRTYIYIPYNLARRINTIVSCNRRRQDHLTDLKTTLMGRNFPEGVIDKGIEMANKLSLVELRTPKANIVAENLAFVSTFSPFSPNVYKTIRDNFDSLKGDNHMREVLEGMTLVHGRRQGPNLKTILTKARFNKPEEGSFPCKRPRCKCCKEIVTTKEVFFHKVGKTHKITERMTCVSQNLIYKLTCRGCNEYYIGETGDYFHMRVNTHRSGVTNDNSLKVDEHIFSCTSHLPIGQRFEVVPFYKVREDNTSIRRKIEISLINEMNPLLNRLK